MTVRLRRDHHHSSFWKPYTGVLPLVLIYPLIGRYTILTASYWTRNLSKTVPLSRTYSVYYKASSSSTLYGDDLKSDFTLVN